MVVYAVAADVSILRVFLAGFLPGLLLMALFSGYIVMWALLNPGKTPPDHEVMTLKQKLHASRQLIPCILLIVFVVWVIVAGYATATESAAYGVLGSLALACDSGSLNRRNLWNSMMGATRLSCMILFILACASYITIAMGFTGIPRALAEWIAVINSSRYASIAMLAVVNLVLGVCRFAARRTCVCKTESVRCRSRTTGAQHRSHCARL